MRALVLGLLLLCAPLAAKEPWARGYVVDLTKPEGSWASTFMLGQLDGPWAIFNCACDVQEFMEVRVALKRSSASIRGKGQILVASAKNFVDETGDESHYLSKVRYLGSKKSETLDGFPITILYFEVPAK